MVLIKVVISCVSEIEKKKKRKSTRKSLVRPRLFVNDIWFCARTTSEKSTIKISTHFMHLTMKWGVTELWRQLNTNFKLMYEVDVFLWSILPRIMTSLVSTFEKSRTRTNIFLFGVECLAIIVVPTQGHPDGEISTIETRTDSAIQRSVNTGVKQCTFDWLISYDIAQKGMV